MSTTVRRATRALALAVAVLAVGAVAAPAQFADYPPLRNTADPGVLPFNGGYLVAATSSVTARGVMPIKFSKDLRSWRKVGQLFQPGTQAKENPSGVPGWIDLSKSRGLWAPEIALYNGDFVMTYSAILKPNVDDRYKKGGVRCLGRAETSGTNNFRFQDLGRPLLCNPDGDYSLIDQSLYKAPNGQNYLLYKRDRPDGVNKEIAIAPIGADGLSDIKPAQGILKPTQPWETQAIKGAKPSVEAPTMQYKNGYYYLFYSGAQYNTDDYGVGVARSRSPLGPFEKNPGNPILSGDRTPSFCGVGHQAVIDGTSQGWLIFYHAYRGSKKEKCKTSPGRFMKIDQLRMSASGWPFVNRSGKPTGPS